MSRWDALRSDRRTEPVASGGGAAGPNSARSFQRRQPQSRSIGSSRNVSRFCPQWDRLLERIKNAPEHVHAADVTRVMQEEQPPPTSLGDALVMMLSSDIMKTTSEARLDLACRLMQQRGRTIKLSNAQAQACGQSLAQQAISSSSSVEATCLFLQRFHTQLSVEHSTSVFIGDKILFLLERDNNSDCSLQILILKTIQTLFSDERYALSLLAPLIVDVSDQGEEATIANPLKTRLFKILQCRLGHATIGRVACQCLTTALSLPACGKGKQPLDLAAVECVVSSRLRDEWSDGLALLKALLSVHPESSSSMMPLLLGDTTQPGGDFRPGCSCHTRSRLLALLHSNRDDLISMTVQDLLKSFPLGLWLGGKQPRRVAPSLGQHFVGDRVSGALVDLIQIVTCRIAGGPAMTTKAVWKLTGSILMDIPYQGGNTALCTAATELVATVGAYIVTRRDRMLLFAVDCLVESMGGRIRPDGTHSIMSLPTRNWLESSLGQKFLDHLLLSLGDEDAIDDTRNISFRVVGSILEGAPHVVLNSDDRIATLWKIITQYTSSASHIARLDGLGVLEKTLMGRRDRPETLQGMDSVEFASFAANIARTATQDLTAAVRSAGLRCLGAFNELDWLEFSENIVNCSSTELLQHSQILLSHCVTSHSGLETIRGEANSNTRVAACKAIADVCAAYLGETLVGRDTHDDVQLLHFSKLVADVLTVAVLDTVASVRSAAVFGLGNLALGLRGAAGRDVCFVPPSLLRLVFDAVVKSINDENDKVASNAIRAAGHVVSLAFKPPYRGVISSKEWSSSKACIGVQSVLQKKVKVALSENLGSPKALSWKQRSVAKKQGWGACHALAVIIDCGVAWSEDVIDTSRGSLRWLVTCLQMSNSIDGKVASTATVAIRNISVQGLSHLSGPSGLIGSAISACLSVVFKPNRRHSPNRLQDESALLLQHLLGAASIFDMCHMLKSETVSTSYLDRLYGWMVDQGMSSDAFESLALALQRRDISGDISLEQKFASRALLRYREDHTQQTKGIHESAASAAHGHPSSDDTDEDEL